MLTQPSIQHGVGLVGVRGDTHPALLDHCLAAGVLVAGPLSEQQLRALCWVSHTTAVTSVLHCREVRA